MADDQVKYSELVKNDNNNFQSLIDALEKVKEKLAELKAEASNLSSSLRSVGTATKQQQQSTAEDAAAAERLSRDVKTLTDEEARLKAAIAEANRMQKLQAQANSAAAGSLNEMRAKYKLLVAEMGNYNLKSAEGQRKMKATAAEARRLRDEIYKLESAYGQFGRNVGNYSGALSRFGARLKEAAARFVAFNTAFLSFTGLIRFGKALYETRKELESTLVTYKALAGEIQGAKLFEEVKNFALSTPVTLNAASKAVQTMLSFGVSQEKVVDIMKRLGDISSADSERMQRLALAYSQATQAGRLMGQDTLQFINAGFNPLYYISLRTGESMEYLRDQMKKGKIDISQVTQAIIDATSEGGQFNGMLEKQRDTMKGAAAIMEGAWQNMLNEMGSDMESGIVGIIKWLTKLMQNWRETIRTMRQIAVSIGTAKVALLILEKTMWKVTASTEAATNATNKFGLALKKIPVFLAVSVFTMLVQKLIDTNREMNRLKDYTKEFADVETEMNKEMKKEISRLDQLFAELRKAKKGTAEYKSAQQAIIDGFGKYDETLGKELSDVNNLKTAYDKLTTSIQNSYKTKARQSFMEKSETRLGESEAKLRQELNEFVEDYTDENGNWSTKRLKGGALPRAIYNNVQNYLQYGRWLDGQVASQIINGRLGWGNGDLGRAALQYQTALRAFKEANQRADALWGPYVEPTETGYTPVTTGGADDDGKPVKDKVKDLLTLQRALEDAQTANIEDEYRRAVEAEEKRHERFIQDRKAELNLLSEDDPRRAVINKQIEEEEKTHYLNRRKLRSDHMAKMRQQWDKNAKEAEDAAKKEAKATYNALAQGWQEERTKLVERGAKKKELIQAEIDAEINRLQTMLTVQRSINGEIMTPEEKAKIEEWIRLLNQFKAAGNFNQINAGQIFGNGASNIGKKQKGNYTSVIDILFPDWESDKQNALKSVFDQAKEALNSWMDARKAAADQAKELADDEVSAAENALNREIELRNQGYANDVALREKELADAKEKQRQAVELQKQYEKEQVLLDAAMQASSMITASANIFKQFPIYVAIPMLATLWGAFAYAKVQAYQAAEKSITFGEGGAMLLEGGSHQSGHDISLGIGPDGSNLRAEGGEYFAVINKRNSRKYGSEIPGIVNALNSGMFEDKYIKTSDAIGLLPPVVKADDGTMVDLSRVEDGVSALVRQGEKSWTVEGSYRVLRYKNLTRRVKIG